MAEFEHKRSHRVAHLIQQELAKLLVEGLKDPRVGFVTVTEVRVTDDLRAAVCCVSIFGSDEARQESLEGLHAAAGFLRREVGHRLKLRYAPMLTFSHDKSLDRAQRVEELLMAAARGDAEAPTPMPEAELPPVQTRRALPMAVPPPPAPKPVAASKRRRRPRKHSY